jgi:MFS family permease
VHTDPAKPVPWYHGITRYQWVVLLIASLGWVFDVFEGQIFVASMNEAMPALLPQGTPPGDIAYYNNLAFGAFLLGGALGGVLFGALSDRIGRTKTMVYTILAYSLFTCLSALSMAWWHLAVFRFLVALGVGGEWAVASALVAEVFPKRARAWSLAIFHASSVFGTYLAIAAGAFVVANPNLSLTIPWFGEKLVLTSWRLGFLLGAAPAVLIIWIRLSLREPEGAARARREARAEGQSAGQVADLFVSGLAQRTLVGVGLAAVGLATFWGAHIYGKDTLRAARTDEVLRSLPADLSPEAKEQALSALGASLKRWEMLGMLLVTTGGGLGLVAFGPLSEWLGRRGAFLAFQLGGLASALILFQVLATLSHIPLLLAFLPVFGFLTLGMHAGYAVYFPELFPTRLRGTGSGFCFNVGRILAAPILFLGGWMQKDWGLSRSDAASLLSLLFLLGAVLLLFAPETKGQELPE